jgi:hypothetical protein
MPNKAKNAIVGRVIPTGSNARSLSNGENHSLGTDAFLLNGSSIAA